GAGEPVHLDLGRRGAVGEVLERLTLHPHRVPVQPGGAVEARRPELDPLEVGVSHQVAPGDPPPPGGSAEADAGDHAAGEPHVAGMHAELAGRPRIWSQAFLIAPPLRSEPELAAVAEVFGTLSVRVGASRTRCIGTPSAVAATWIILVCRPWPISVPPWLISTEPSLYTCTSAPAWLNAVRLNEMPNLTGVIASPRLTSGCVALNA